MSNPTLDQGFQMIKIARESGATLERIQAIHNLGLLSDLMMVENPNTVDREAFRKALGINPSVSTVKVGGHEDPDEKTPSVFTVRMGGPT